MTTQAIDYAGLASAAVAAIVNGDTANRDAQATCDSAIVSNRGKMLTAFIAAVAPLPAMTKTTWKLHMSPPIAAALVAAGYSEGSANNMVVTCCKVGIAATNGLGDKLAPFGSLKAAADGVGAALVEAKLWESATSTARPGANGKPSAAKVRATIAKATAALDDAGDVAATRAAVAHWIANTDTAGGGTAVTLRQEAINLIMAMPTAKLSAVVTYLDATRAAA